jgi:hypothetical protein
MCISAYSVDTNIYIAQNSGCSKQAFLCSKFKISFFLNSYIPKSLHSYGMLALKTGPFRHIINSAVSNFTLHILASPLQIEVTYVCIFL